ncbi:hypothetical protein [Pseudomonas putida]|uniref:hypothetical protein n=1 Tax=Pseudomonas putida TaxID=303 RepID=UPI00383AAD6D
MQIPKDVEALVASGALFVANHSGGKDSQAQLIKLLEVIPPRVTWRARVAWCA